MLAAQRQGPERAALLKTARGAAKQMGKSRFDWGGGMGDLQLAAIATVEGKASEALSHVERAEARFVEAKAPLFRCVAAYARGTLLGGEAGRALIASASAQMAAEGTIRPERIMRMIGPVVVGS